MLPLVILGVLGAGLLVAKRAEARIILEEPMPRVLIPTGWRRATPKELDAAALKLAQERVKSPGAPGTFIERDGWGSLTEWHYHEPNGPIKPWGWHRGITILKRA